MSNFKRTIIYTTIISLLLGLGFVVSTWAKPEERHFKVNKDRITVMEFDNLRLEVPAGASEDDITISEGDANLDGIEKPYGFQAIGKPYRFGPHGRKFDKDKRLNFKMKVNSKDLPKGYSIDSVHLYYINREEKRLERVSDQKIHRKEDIVEANLEHFSEYVAGVNPFWDGNGILPFMDYVNNGEEKVRLFGRKLSIESNVIELAGKNGMDLKVNRVFTGANDIDFPFNIGDGWILDLPFYWQGKLHLPGGAAYEVERYNEDADSDVKKFENFLACYYNDYLCSIVFMDGKRLDIPIEDSKYMSYQTYTDPKGNTISYNLTRFHADNASSGGKYVYRVTSITDTAGHIFNLKYNTYNQYPACALNTIEQRLNNGNYRQILSVGYDGRNFITYFTNILGKTSSYTLVQFGFGRNPSISNINYPSGLRSEYIYDRVYGISSFTCITSQKVYLPGDTLPYRTTNYTANSAGTQVDVNDGVSIKRYCFTGPSEHYAMGYETLYQEWSINGKLLNQITPNYQWLNIYGNGYSYYVGLKTSEAVQYAKSDGSLGSASTTYYEYDNFYNITRKVDPNGNETRFAYANTNSIKNLSTITTDKTDTKVEMVTKTVTVSSSNLNATIESLQKSGATILETNKIRLSTSYRITYQILEVITYYVPAGYQDALYTIGAGYNQPLTKATIIKDPVHNTTQLKQTHYQYDSQGNLLKEREVYNGSYLDTTYTYDSYGNMLSKTDAKGNIINFEYSSTYNYAYPTRVYKPDGTTIATYEYDFDMGVKTKATDPKGNVYRYSYDALGRLTKEWLDTTDPNLAITREIAYDDINNTVFLKYGNNTKGWQEGLIFYHLALGKPQKIQRKLNGQWVTIKEYDFDSHGRVIAERDNLGHTTSYAYDELDRKIKTTFPNGAFSTVTWDDRVLTTVDPNGNQKIQTFDLLDRLVEVKEFPEPNTPLITSYTYDSASNLVKIVNPKLAETKYTYDNLGRLTRVDYPQDGANPMAPEIYAYDSVGNLISKTGANGTKNIGYEFFAGYRVKQVTESGNKVTTYNYDANDNVLNQTWGLDSYNYTYDARNRVTNLTTNLGGNNFSLDYTYDVFGRVTELGYPGRTQKVTYSYDELDRLQAIPGFVNTCTYDGDNKLTEMLFANGIKNAFDYDVNDRPTNIKSAGIGNLVILDYTYDSSGNINRLNGECYSYDGLNRLTWANTKFASVGTGLKGTAWKYDGAGNRVEQQNYQNGEVVANITLSYDLANRLWSKGNTTYDNDAAGARTSKSDGTDTWNYQYDGESRMTKALKNGASVLENEYDPTGMRYKKFSNGKTTYTVYSGANPLLEYDPSTGGYTYYIYAGTRSIAEEKGGQKTFYHRDHLGSTRATTDDTGKITGLCKYDAWGKLESVNEYDEGVINGEMEITDVLGKVKLWKPVNDQTLNGDCTYQLGQGINGSSALRIDRISGTVNTGWLLPNIYASADTDYELTGYFLSGNAGSDKARVQLVYYNATGEIITIHDSGTLGYSGEGWKQFTLASHAPAGAVTMEIRLTQDVDAGMAVLFDGVKLKIPGLSGKYDYTGKKEDQEIGLKYFGARFYDPETARFLTADTYTNLPNDERLMFLIAPDEIRFQRENVLLDIGFNNNQEYNRYSYCLNNPIKNTDPDGHFVVAVLAAPAVIEATILGIGACVITYELAKQTINNYIAGTSINQVNEQIRTGKAPRTVERADRGKIPGEKDHIHLKGGHALNKDGTWKHGGRELTKQEKEWLEKNGWELPKEESNESSKSKSDDDKKS